MTFVGLAIFKNGARQLRLYQKEFNLVKTDLRLYQNYVLLNHIGLDYFKTKSLYALEVETLRELVPVLKNGKMRGKTLAFFDYGGKLAKLEGKYKNELAEVFWNNKDRKEYIGYLKENLTFVEKKESSNMSVYIFKIE